MARDITPRFCPVEGCDRIGYSGGQFCSTHQKRRERHQDLHAPVRERLSLRERVSQLCIDLADAPAEDTDEERERRWDSLEHALKDWAIANHQRRAGEARWQGTTAKERAGIARRAAQSRWNASPARIRGKRVRGRAHVWTPITVPSRMQSSALKKRRE